MKFSFSHLLVAATTLFTAPAISAQDQVDIGLHRNGDRLEVHVRPSANFDGMFSSVVYTIRWDRATEATLGQLEQRGAAAYYIPTAKSGALRQNGTFNYQVYAGFGITPLEALETAWNAGEEYVIASIPVSGKGEFELVNDAYTEEAAVNADYYVSLGGQDRTGIIYKGLATTDEDGSVTIQPNPNNGHFIFSFGTAEPTDVTVEVSNALGQSVFSETMRGFEGTYRKEMDLTTMSNGVYYLKVKRGEESSTHKIVYR